MSRRNLPILLSLAVLTSCAPDSPTDPSNPLSSGAEVNPTSSSFAVADVPGYHFIWTSKTEFKIDSNSVCEPEFEYLENGLATETTLIEGTTCAQYTTGQFRIVPESGDASVEAVVVVATVEHTGVGDGCSTINSVTPWIYLIEKCGPVQSGDYQLNLLTNTTYRMESNASSGVLHLGKTYRSSIRLNVAAPPPPNTDATPPEISILIDPASPDGLNGWYVSDVVATWAVTDAESPNAITKFGCLPIAVTEDTQGVQSSCGATSPGGAAASQTLTIKKDGTAPVINFIGSAHFTVDQTVSVLCSATDATSGISDVSCPEATGPAYSFEPTNVLAAKVTDRAGNVAHADREFTVEATASTLCIVVREVVGSTEIAEALCRKLTVLENARNAPSKAGQLRAFENQVKGHAEKSISADHAAMLVRWAATL